MKKYLIEIQDSEGGEDSKLLVDEMLSIYTKTLQKNKFKFNVVEKRHGFVSIQLTNENSYKFFLKECGGHRFQRIPPTERNGRMHTSTVMVSVVQDEKFDFEIDKNDVKTINTRGYGAGGQHKNKVETCVNLIHIPTGISVRIDGRNRFQNEKNAWNELYNRLHEHYKSIEDKKLYKEKKDQIGIQNRTNKIRTYNFKTGIVKDHRNNKTISVKELYKGYIKKLH